MPVIHCSLLSGEMYHYEWDGELVVSVGDLIRGVSTHWNQFIWNTMLIDDQNNQSWTVQDSEEQVTVTDGQMLRVFFQDHPFSCWIRYPDDMEGWRRAKSHHECALHQFLQKVWVSSDRTVCVPHEQGGMFRATFIDDNNHPHNDDSDNNHSSPRYAHRWTYVDEYHRTVEIMRSTPEFVGFINRITM